VDYGIATRTALVVGGSKGIGFEVAKMLAGEGCRNVRGPSGMNQL
jgi:3-oxoacyl-[acyl-carrier protein] reductase